MNLYRFHYLKYSNIFELTSYDGAVAKSCVDMVFKPFYSDMNEEDVFKILSFLFDYISFNKRIYKCSIELVRLIDSIMLIDDIGFKKCDVCSDKVKDLFVVGGITNRFNSSEYFNKYINWYIPNISKEDIESIYNKYNIGIVNLNNSLKKVYN